MPQSWKSETAWWRQRFHHRLYQQQALYMNCTQYNFRYSVLLYSFWIVRSGLQLPFPLERYFKTAIPTNGKWYQTISFITLDKDKGKLYPGAEASKVRGAISVTFGNHLSQRLRYCKRDEVYFTITTQLVKTMDDKIALYCKYCFPHRPNFC